MMLRWKRAGIGMVAAVAMGTSPVLPARAATIAPPACLKAGHITYTIHRAANPSPDESSAYDAIDTAMSQAVAFYDCYTEVTKAIPVSYDPGVRTSRGSIGDGIRFGSRASMQQITAMHEISHTLGVGTDPAWTSHVSHGAWTGPVATAELRIISHDQSAVLHANRQSFAPYGLNATSEVQGAGDLVAHCRLVVAMRTDMGL
jgi:hypothetical protein